MRLSDILKKAKGQSAPPEPVAPQPSVPLPQQPASAPTPIKETEPRTVPATSDSPQAHAISAEDAYTKAIIEIKNIIACAQKGAHYADRIECVDAIIDQLQKKSDDMLILVERATPDIYLYGHSVNVCILSLLLGLALGMDRTSLVTLGTAALLHDLGLTTNMGLALKNAKFTPAEQAQLEKRSLDGARLITLISALGEQQREAVAGIILQFHGRKAGSAHPGALKGDDAATPARIIAVTDAYETISHPRPCHDRTIPHETLKSMIAARGEYDAEIMKAFIDRLSLYPPGSYVKLNTDDIARVIGTSAGMPTRPLVKILVGPDRKRAAETRTVDLAATPLLFVKEAVDETNLNLLDKKLSLELKAARWWVKGL